MGTISDKLTYLNTTKNKLKAMISYGLGTPLSNETFREYVNKTLEAFINSMSSTENITWNNLPKVTGTGISASINDTIEAPMKIELNSTELEQETTTGKNILDISNVTTGTTSGVTYKNNGDGTITFNGTATAQIYLNLNLVAGKYITLESGSIYSFGIKNNNSGVQAAVRLVSPNVTILKINFGNSEVTNITSSQSGDAFAFIEIANGTALNNFTIFPMVTKASTLGDYEMFTGNQASPNPSYPQDIHTISGDNEIVVENKNLFDVNSSESGYYDYEVGHQMVKKADTNNWRNTNAIKVLPNTKYTFSANASIRFLRIHEYDSNYIQLAMTQTQNVSTSTITTNANTKYICISFNYNSREMTSAIAKSLNLMLEQSSTATTYVEHKEQVYPINLGNENLLNPEDVAKTTTNGVTFTPSYDENGNLEFININGTASSAISYYYINDNLTLPAGTYYLSDGIGADGGENTNSFFLYTSLGLGQNSYTNNGIFTLSESGTGHVRFVIRSGVAMNNVKIKPMICRVITNNYTPYNQTPIEYCEIGDYADEIKKSTGKNLINIYDKNAFKYGSGSAYATTVDPSGTITTTSNFASSRSKGVIIENLKQNTDYTLSLVIDSITTSSTIKLCEIEVLAYNENDSVVQTLVQTNTGQIGILKQYTFNSGTYYKLIVHISGYYSSGATGTIIYHDLMVNEGSTATSYEPYETGWYIKKNIGKIVLDGSNDENWVEEVEKTITKVFKMPLLDKKRSVNTYLSNYFTNQSGDAEKISLLNDILYLALNKTTATTVNELKTWLSTHNTEVYYILDTPTYILLNNTLQEELNNIEKALSYNEQTNINQVNNDLGFTINASALEDIRE